MSNTTFAEPVREVAGTTPTTALRGLIEDLRCGMADADDLHGALTDLEQLLELTITTAEGEAAEK